MKTLTKVMMAAAIATAIAGCTPPTTEKSAIIEDKLYTIAPDQFKITAGILKGEVTGITVFERVEQGTGKVDSAAKLKGKLVLTNTSTDQSVRLINGRFTFIDDQGNLIKLEESRTDPTLAFAGSYNSPDRLDPGKNFTQDVDVNFPAEALKGKKLAEIRIEIEYMPASYRKDTVSFKVTVNTK